MSLPQLPTGLQHIRRLRIALERLEASLPTIEQWGITLAGVLTRGGRLLVAGNGGSAAQSEHLAAELVGRYRIERRPFSVLALTCDSSSVTAIGNDYGVEEMFARQVRAHGRPGDVFLGLSTSGQSPNVVAAAREAYRSELAVWALTGVGPNPLCRAAHEYIAVHARDTATVQECHLAALHVMCGSVDRAVARDGRSEVLKAVT